LAFSFIFIKYFHFANPLLLIAKIIIGLSFKINGNDKKLKSFFVLATQVKTASETVKFSYLFK